MIYFDFDFDFVCFFSLYKAAEEARLPKRLRSDLGGALREFTSRESHCFAQSKNQDGSLALFTSQERQWLVLQVLQGFRASTNDLASLQGKASVEEGQSISNKYKPTNSINSFQRNYRFLFQSQPGNKAV